MIRFAAAILSCLFPSLAAAQYQPVNDDEAAFLDRIERLGSCTVTTDELVRARHKRYDIDNEPYTVPMPLYGFAKNGSSDGADPRMRLIVNVFDVTTTFDCTATGDGRALVDMRFTFVRPYLLDEVHHRFVFFPVANEEFLMPATLDNDWPDDQRYDAPAHIAPLWIARVFDSPVTVVPKLSPDLIYCDKTSPDQTTCSGDNYFPLVSESPKSELYMEHLLAGIAAQRAVEDERYGISPPWGPYVTAGISTGARVALVFARAHDDTACTYAASGVDSWDDVGGAGMTGVLSTAPGRIAIAYDEYDALFKKESWETIDRANSYRSGAGLPTVDFRLSHNRSEHYKGHRWPHIDGLNWIAGCIAAGH